MISTGAVGYVTERTIGQVKALCVRVFHKRVVHVLDRHALLEALEDAPEVTDQRLALPPCHERDALLVQQDLPVVLTGVVGSARLRRGQRARQLQAHVTDAELAGRYRDTGGLNEGAEGLVAEVPVRPAGKGLAHEFVGA